MYKSNDIRQLKYLSQNFSSLTCTGEDFAIRPIQVIESGIWKLNVISSLPSWMKSWVYSFINWMGIIHEFREHLFLIAAGSVLIHFWNLQVTCKVQSCGVACDLSHRRNLTRQRSNHFSRYQTKRCLILGTILNSVTLWFCRWINGSTHHWYQFPLSL